MSDISNGSDDMLLREIDVCIADWTDKCGKSLALGDVDEYLNKRNQISTILEWRRQIRAELMGINVIVNGQGDARGNAIKLIESQRQLDESFSIPRTEDGEVVTVSMGLTYHNLLLLHRNMQKRMIEGAFIPKSVRERTVQLRRTSELTLASSSSTVMPSNFNLFLDMKMAICKVGEAFNLYFSLWSKSKSSFLTDEFVVALTALGWPQDNSLTGKLFTVFADAVRRGESFNDLVLVCRMYRYGALLIDETAAAPSRSKGTGGGTGSKGASEPAEVQFQRPFGCAVLDLGAARVADFQHGIETEISEPVRIYRPARDADKNFPHFHETLISGVRTECEEVPQCMGIKISLGLIPGTAKDMKAENEELQGKISCAALTHRMPDTTMTGQGQGGGQAPQTDQIPEVREYLYVTICGGDFSQGSKSAAMNVSIAAYCLSNDGAVIPNCIARGTGKQSPLVSNYATSVYYHVNNPVINETFHIDLNAVPNLLNSHLLITVSHCSTNTATATSSRQSESFFGASKDKKARSVVGFCVLPFMDQKRGGVVVDDQTHVLECFSPLSSMELSHLDGGSVVAKRSVTGSVKDTAPYLLPTQEKARLKRTLSSSFASTKVYEELVVKTAMSSLRYTSVRAIHSIMHANASTKESSLAADIGDCMQLPDSSLFQFIVEILKSLSRIISDRPMLEEPSFKLFVKLLSMVRKSSLTSQKSTIGSDSADINAVNSFSEGLIQCFASNTTVVLLRDLNAVLKEIVQNPGSIQHQHGQEGFSLRTVSSLPSILLLVNAYNLKTGSKFSGDKSDLSQLVQSINDIMQKSSSDSEIIKILRNDMFTIYKLLEQHFDDLELAQIAKGFLHSVHCPSGAVSSQVKNIRINFVKNILSCSVFQNSKCREILLPFLVDALRVYMVTKDEEATAMNLLQIVIEKIERQCSDADYNFFGVVLVPTLHCALKMVENFHSNISEAAVTVDTSLSGAPLAKTLETATCNICCIIEVLGHSRVVGMMARARADRDRDSTSGANNFMISLLVTLTLLVKKAVLPHPWLLLHMKLLKTCSDVIAWSTQVLLSDTDFYLDISHTFVSTFVESKYFGGIQVIEALADDGCIVLNNLSLWLVVLESAMTLLHEPGLNINSVDMNPARKVFLVKNYDDMRVGLIADVERCWKTLRSHANRSVLGSILAPSLTVPFIATACSPFETCATVGKYLLVDIMSSDFEVNGDFPLTACHIYDSVSATLLRASNKHQNTSGTSVAVESRYLAPHDALVQFIEKDMDALFRSHGTLNCEKVHQFSGEMRELLRLLEDLSGCPKTTEYEEERSFAYSKLMDFLLRMDRKDAYIKFAHNLSKEMEGLELHTEAANAILLHYNLLEWSSAVVLDSIDLAEEGLVLPAELAWQRKKNLCEMAISLFEKGKAFESCIKLLDELADVYKRIYHDYTALSAILERQVLLYNQITNSERYFPTMFRVGYYGQGFANVVIRNKEFIYRGLPLESIIDFSSRIKKKFPSCEILAPKVNPTPEDHLNVDKQFIQISKVTPATIAEANGDVAPDFSKLPSYVKSDLLNNNTNCFFYQRPFRKRATKSANEFLDLWVEKRFLITSVVFPSYTRRAEVTSVAVVIFNPIEMAIIGLEERNADLSEKNCQMASMADHGAGQSFTMALSGTVDAAVNGGIKNYESFINGSYRTHNPEIAEDVDGCANKTNLVGKMVDILLDQLKLLDTGIHLHRRKCLESMQPLHAHIETTYSKMKSELLLVIESRNTHA